MLERSSEATAVTRVVLVTDASMPTGRLAAYALADSGDTVYVGIPEACGRNAELFVTLVYYAREHGVDLYPVDLDPRSAASLNAVRAMIVATCGRLDRVLHVPYAKADGSGVRPKPPPERASAVQGSEAHAATPSAA